MTGSPNGDTTGHDPGVRQVLQRHYDPEESIEFTTTLVAAIADAKGVEATEVGSPPLYDVVDAAALENTVFGAETPRRSRRGSGTVSFRYDGLVVEVESDGWIHVYEPAGGDETEE
ncbi:HalOD1 output domain-containing protein [Saliphagus sp. LR7]|uniref:HalOD1 output domain-containing protein n=1 Tax=Saliphagus sp. LR7 TaxID=2282654 RepID=UPI001300750C|nr:HalOD1 output domain-containing protein [Saliphagus sp. LR7]